VPGENSDTGRATPGVERVRPSEVGLAVGSRSDRRKSVRPARTAMPAAAVASPRGFRRVHGPVVPNVRA
jgi:hypothetical protein